MRAFDSSSRSDGLKRSGGVRYDSVTDRRIEDPRHERERAYKDSKDKGAGPAVSSTFDAFQRMAAGLEPRTLADNMSNPNRPTWEQYKKDNEDKLDLVGADMKKMADYRAQLDREREGRLGGKRKMSDDDDDSSGAAKKKSKKKKSRKEHKKSGKKEKKKSGKVRGCAFRFLTVLWFISCVMLLQASKDRRRSRSRSESSSSSSGGDEPIRLSEFLRGPAS